MRSFNLMSEGTIVSNAEIGCKFAIQDPLDCVTALVRPDRVERPETVEWPEVMEVTMEDTDDDVNEGGDAVSILLGLGYANLYSWGGRWGSIYVLNVME